MILEFDDIFTRYADTEDILKGVSFGVPKGTFLGVIGPNGSGKTTLLRAATRVLKPHKGIVRFMGDDINKKDPLFIAKNIAVVPQNSPSGFSFSVFDVAMMGRYPHKKRFERSKASDFELVNNALKLTDCTHLAKKDFDELSAGERQRVIIARSLAQEPGLLMLDEPTSHLDIGHEIQIFDLIKKLNIENKLTIIAILHDLNIASQFCDKILLLDKGEVVKYGRPEEVLDYRIIEEVYRTPVVVEKSKITGGVYVNLVSKFNLKNSNKAL